MGGHKDGLTASCRHFEVRKDYRSGHWIQCRMGTRAFESAWERNQYYRSICCQGGRGCELMNIRDRMRGDDPRHE